MGELAGTDKPGLTAWPMTSARKRTKRMKHKGIDKDKIPIAMHISPKRQKQKTIVINKNRSPVKAKPALIAKSAPHSLGGANFAKPVNVTMPGSKKPFTIDPNKSLLQQMAEMDN